VNCFQYANPAVDKLLSAADITLDPDARRDLFQQAERLIGDDVPGIPSQVNSTVTLVSSHLKGWIDNEGYPQSRWFTLED
jgi:ABC-type transport system substrate-binding protein